jgi:cytochrome P450 family 628
MPLQRKTIAYF